ncbi:MAG TPA: PH domain-containing protein [Cellulomonas sp.]
MPTSDRDWTYRPRSSVPTTAAIVVVAAGLAFAQWATGGAADLARALPFALAGAFAGWLVFYKPHVRVADDGVHVVNPFAAYDVPWAALIQVRTRFACTFVTPHRAVQAFAAPGPGRYAVAMATVVDLRTAGALPSRGLGLGELPSGPSGQVATVVRRRWDELVQSGRLSQGEADETPVPRTWDVRSAVVLAALLVAGVALQLAH